MGDRYTGEERREFIRCDYEEPVHCRTIKSSDGKKSFSSSIKGIVKNLSASGILFIVSSESTPKIANMLLLELDYQTSSICQEIEKQSLIARNRFLGKVVRIENNDDNTCDVGVALIPKYNYLPEDIKVLVGI